MNTGELDGDTVAVEELEVGKKCFGRAKLNVCGAGLLTCLLEMVTTGGAEFTTPRLKGGDSLGDEGDVFCSCCCSSNTWL